MSSTGEEDPIVKGDSFIPSIFFKKQKEIVIIEKLKKEKKNALMIMQQSQGKWIQAKNLKDTFLPSNLSWSTFVSKHLFGYVLYSKLTRLIYLGQQVPKSKLRVFWSFTLSFLRA